LSKDYKPHSKKTKEEKAMDKWVKKGRPRPLNEDLAVKQYLEQESLSFGDGIRKNGLVMLEYMRPDDIVYLMELCADALARRGLGVRPVPEQKATILDAKGEPI
jgi:hypothetical protein